MRAYHFLRNPPMWGDEGATAANILAQGYGEIGGPLRMHQAMPPVFQALERAIARGLGEGEWTLRLLPFVASCATLVLMALAVPQLLGGGANERGWAAVVAVGIVAFSDRMLWHASEGKVYALDACVGAAALAWFGATRGKTGARRILPVVLVVPVVLWSSFPAVFIGAALVAAFWIEGPAVGETRRARRMWVLLLGAVMVASLLPLVAGPMRSQKDTAIMEWWGKYFFPAATPWRGPIWALGGTAALFDFMLRPAGVVLLLPAAAGVVALWQRDRALAMLTLAPPVMAFCAACVRQYPFGGARIMMFALPGLAVVVAEGVRWGLGVRARWRTWARGVIVVICGGALVAALALDGVRVIRPWPRPDTRGAAEYVMRARDAGDAVVSNDWSYAYYFRGLGKRYGETEDDVTVGAGAAARVWVIASGEDAGAGAFVARWIDRGWEAAGPAREFALTRVMLLRRGVR